MHLRQQMLNKCSHRCSYKHRCMRVCGEQVWLAECQGRQVAIKAIDLEKMEGLMVSCCNPPLLMVTCLLWQDA